MTHEPKTTTDSCAELINQTMPDVEGTLPRPNIQVTVTTEELDWVEHAARLRNLSVVEYTRQAINLALMSEGVDAVLLAESDDEESGPICESCDEPATRKTLDDVDMCEECYRILCDEQDVTGEEVGSATPAALQALLKEADKWQKQVRVTTYGDRGLRLQMAHGASVMEEMIAALRSHLALHETREAEAFKAGWSRQFSNLAAYRQSQGAPMAADPSTPSTRTLKDYRPQHDDDCSIHKCGYVWSDGPHCRIKAIEHGIGMSHELIPLGCTCGLDALVAVSSREIVAPPETKEDGAGLICQPIPDMAGTEPRPNSQRAINSALRLIWDTCVPMTTAADCMLMKPCKRPTCRCSQPMFLGDLKETLRGAIIWTDDPIGSATVPVSEASGKGNASSGDK